MNLKIGLNRIVAYRTKQQNYYKKNIIKESEEFLTEEEKTEKKIEKKENEKEKKEKKEFSFSQRSKSRLKMRLSWFIEQSRYRTIYSKKNKQIYKYKLAMITLTLPMTQKEDDRKNKNEYLNHFFTIMKRCNYIHNYIWRAEKQKNGNIHYHIIIDRYIHHSIIKNKWNNILKKNGYLENNKNPNSTDIHALKNIKNVHAYLIKYMSKNENNNSEVKGRAWSCSKGIVKNCVDIDLNYDEYEYDILKKELKNIDKEKIINKDYYVIYIINIKDICKKYKEIKNLFNSYINNMQIALYK